MKKILSYSLLLCFLLNHFNSQAQRLQKKPNVLFIAVDDLSIAFQAFGNPDAPTPNFIRMMQHGMLFKTTYCQFPLCSPSRTVVMSGKRPDATGVVNNETSIRTKLGQNYKFIPEYFHSYGYRTERYGKMMCTSEKEISWDYEYKGTGHTRWDLDQAPYYWIDTIPKDETETAGGRATDALIKRIKQPVSTPYFYALGLLTHNPFTPILKSWNKIGVSREKELLPVDQYGTITDVRGNRSTNIILPNTPENDTKDIPEIALKKDQAMIQYPHDEWQRIRHGYYAEITEMDVHLGVVLDELDRLGLWNNTVVVFFSDHGLHMGEHEGLWLKGTLFEEALRVPFVICAPGKKTGICERPVELVDIFSTLAELCGLPTPPEQQGSSLVPLLESPKAPWKEAIFSQVTRPDDGGIMGRSVRTEQLHYNFWEQYGEELYDIQNDPHEYNNLAYDPTYKQALNHMQHLLKQGWQALIPSAIAAKSEIAVSELSVSSSPSFSLYPNPSTGKINVTYNGKSTGNILLRVLDMEGRSLVSKTEQAITGINTYGLNLSNVKEGIYSLELSDGNLKKQKKFVIEK